MVTAGGAALALLAGCAAGAPTDNAADAEDKGGDVHVAWWGGESRAERFQQIVDGYAATLDGDYTFSTEFSGFNDFFPKIATAAAAGDLSDVLFITERQVNDFAPTLLDLRPYVESGELDLSAFDDAFVDGGTIDDRLVMMNVGATYPTIMYDKTLFDQAGVPIPEGQWTWDDFKKTAIQLSEKLGPDVWGAADSANLGALFEQFLVQRGAALFDGDELAFEEDDLADWLQLWADLRDAGATPPGDVTIETQANTFESSLFGTHRVAMYYTSHNQLPTFQEFMPDDELGLLPAPIDGDGDDVSLIIGTFMSVSAKTANPHAAVGLLNYWVNNPDAIKLFGLEFGSPGSSKVAEQVAADASPAQQKVLDFGTNAAADAVLGSVRPRGGTEVESIIARANEAVASGSMSVADAAAQFYAEMQSAVG